MTPEKAGGEGRILFRNKACLVINKAVGESSESIAPVSGVTKTFPVHRLDVPVTGCLLLALTKEAAAFLGAGFSRGEGSGLVEKRYWAIVEKPAGGTGLQGGGKLIHRLYQNPGANKARALPLCEGPPPPNAGRGFTGPQEAALRWSLAGEGENYLFLEIELITGRHHQIRAQLEAIGLHIKGDLKYGARRSEKQGGIRLHARSLSFPNPLISRVSGDVNRTVPRSGNGNPLDPAETISVLAPPPGDRLWQAFIDSAGK